MWGFWGTPNILLAADLFESLFRVDSRKSVLLRCTRKSASQLKICKTVSRLRVWLTGCCFSSRTCFSLAAGHFSWCHLVTSFEVFSSLGCAEIGATDLPNFRSPRILYSPKSFHFSRPDSPKTVVCDMLLIVYDLSILVLYDISLHFLGRGHLDNLNLLTLLEILSSHVISHGRREW